MACVRLCQSLGWGVSRGDLCAAVLREPGWQSPQLAAEPQGQGGGGSPRTGGISPSFTGSWVLLAVGLGAISPEATMQKQLSHQVLTWPPSAPFVPPRASSVLWLNPQPGGAVVNNLLADAGDIGLIPGLGGSPGEGNDTRCLRASSPSRWIKMPLLPYHLSLSLKDVHHFSLTRFQLL